MRTGKECWERYLCECVCLQVREALFGEWFHFEANGKMGLDTTSVGLSSEQSGRTVARVFFLSKV